LTPKSTPTAFPDCNSLAMTDSQNNRKAGEDSLAMTDSQNNRKAGEVGIAANHNCLRDREIDTENTNPLSHDNENGEGGIRFTLSL